MDVVGYSNEFRVKPGGQLNFHVSCRAERFTVQILRIYHGDANPEGPGQKFEPVAADCNGEFPGQFHQIHSGSYMSVDRVPDLSRGSWAGWIYPTFLQGVRQTLFYVDGPDGGLSLGFDDDNSLCAWHGHSCVLRSPETFKDHHWYWVGFSWNEEGTLALHIEAQDWHLKKYQGLSLRGHLERDSNFGGHILLAAELSEHSGTRYHFDGKIENPGLFSRALETQEFEQLRAGAPAVGLPGCIADWDFAGQASTDQVFDHSGSGVESLLRRQPIRAVTGHAWNGEVYDYKYCPDQYGAIFFHAEDTADAGWPVSFSFNVPEDLPSGVYGARLRTADGEDIVPFFVCPRNDQPTADLVFLAPTLSYLAYANEQMATRPDIREANESRFCETGEEFYPVTPEDRYMSENRLLSLYDRRRDWSGVCYAAKRRPLLSFRPGYNMPLLGERGAPHQFSADLHLIDWLYEKSLKHDVITDEDLHEDGSDLLSNYRVVVTGTHPEYWTGAMLDGLQEYLMSGGRVMYLGGNGFYWVTSLDPHDSAYIEVRRGLGSGSWRAHPAEEFHSSTGEKGGLWRFRGRTPQSLVGVGMTSMGDDEGRPYLRTPEASDPKWAFLFEGLDPDEPIGDLPNLVLGYGAGGFEIDRADPMLGTPDTSTVLATARVDSGDSYQHVIEELDANHAFGGGTVNPLVRADMVWTDYPRNGAVFSVGSILWCGCLSANNYVNSVSNVTQNVLRRMLADTEI